MRALWHLGWLGALTGCGADDPSAVLDRAIDDLAGSLLGDELRILFFATLVVALARWGARRLARQGLDPGGRVDRMATLTTAATVLLAVALGLGVLVQRAPATLPWAVGGLALLVVLGLAGVARAFAAGVGLAVRDRIHVGDRIEVGSLRGRVERVGLLSIRVARPDGAVAYLPAHRLAGEAVEVAHARRGTPVEWRFEAPRALTAAERRQLRDLLVLSPYRDPAGEPGLSDLSGGDIRLTLPVWSPAAVPAATDWLDARLEVFRARLGSQGDGPTPPQAGAGAPPEAPPEGRDQPLAPPRVDGSAG